MNEYREHLQFALIANSKNQTIKHSNTQTFKQFYAVCELVAYAAFLSGWLGAIITHL